MDFGENNYRYLKIYLDGFRYKYSSYCEIKDIVSSSHYFQIRAENNVLMLR